MNLQISFEGADAGEANRFAGELVTELNSIDTQVQANRIKADADTMDLGTIVGVIAGSGATLALAKGIADWLARRQQATITIRAGGEVVATGVTSKDAVRLMELAQRGG